MKYSVEKQSRTHSIILAVIVVIAVVLGVVLWRGVQQATPQEKLLAALKATTEVLTSTEPRRSEVVVELSDGSTDSTLTIDGLGTDKYFAGTGTLGIAAGEVNLMVDTDVVSIKNKAYVKLENVGSALDAVAAENAEFARYTGYAELAAEQLEDRWIQLDSLTNSQQCLRDTFALMKQNEAQLLFSQLPVEEATNSDGAAVYSLTLNKKQLNTLFEQFNGTAGGAQLSSACGGLSAASKALIKDSSSTQAYSITFTVSGTNNYINKLTVSSGNRLISIEHTVKSTDTSVQKPSEPTDIISLSDAQNVLENIIGSPAN